MHLMQLLGHPRECPGKMLADNTLFIAIAMMLATLDISKAKDESGREIEPDCIYTPGVVRLVEYYVCCVMRTGCY